MKAITATVKLLFIHGAGGFSQEWIYQTEYFKNSVAISLPGHYEGEPASSIEGYVDWLGDYIRQQRYQDVILAGHSMGGAIALLYGLRHPAQTKGLILIGTGARLRVLPALLAQVKAMANDEETWRRFVEDTYRSVATQVRQVLVKLRTRVGPRVMLNDLLCCDKFDVINDVHNIKSPTLVLCGSEDEMTPVKYTRFLAERIQGAQQAIIQGAGHFVFVEKPKEVNQVIEEFLESLYRAFYIGESSIYGSQLGSAK